MPTATQTPYATYRYVLPFPPSVNTYWRRKGSRYFISKKGVEFKKAVNQCVKRRPNTRRRLQVTIGYQRQDNVDYDIDNYAKAVQDALQSVGVYQDDGQVDKLIQERLPVAKVGACYVEVKEIGAARTIVRVV